MSEHRIEPLRLLSVDALAAGWYLVSRLAVRSLVFWLVPVVASFFIVQAGYVFPGAIAFCVGVIAGVGAVIQHAGRLTSLWAESRWGQPIADEDGVWLSILGRTVVATMVFGVVTAPLGVAGATTAPALLAVLGLVQIVFAVAAAGWAMSKAAATQVARGYPLPESSAPVTAERTDQPEGERAQIPTRSVERRVVPQPVPTPRSRPAAEPAPLTAPRPAGSAAGTETQQCPKCKLYETERGAVIGWYCRICGWRESRG